MGWIRFGGLAGACLLALTGVVGGALPHGDLTTNPVSVARGEHGAFILLGWLAGTAILAGAWWAARDRVPSPRWALVTIALWVAPFLVVPPMESRDLYSYACQGHLLVNGVNPYSAGVSVLPCPWLDAVSPIWRDTPAPYGPVFLLLAGLAVLAGGTLAGVILMLRLFAVAGLLAVAASVPVLARRCGVPVERALWLALAGPVVGIHLISGAHNDALMIGAVLAALALLVLRPPHPVVQLGAGLLLGLAVAIKVTAIVIVPFAVLIAVAPVRGERIARMAGPALRVAGSTLLMLVTVTAASGLGFGWAGGMVRTGDLVQFTSPPTAVGITVTYAGGPFLPGFDAVPTVRLLAVLVLAIVLVLLWLRCAFNPGDPVRAALRGAGLASAAIIVLAPSFHPWYVMFPLILLAATTVRTELVMVAATLAAFLVLPDGGGLARFAKFAGAPLLTVLLVVLLVHHRRRLLAPMTKL